MMHSLLRTLQTIVLLFESVMILSQETAAAEAVDRAASADITIDAADVTGTIKPLHDVGLGPLNMRDFIDLSDYYRELGIRNVRLHDVPWVYENIQDMCYVFPNEHADPTKPENYDFGMTDHYIASITSLGINIIYRLGYSADYVSPERFRHVNPPASYEKWSDIAANIVRHYSKGWTNGPKDAIRYWEIWNEPDISLFWRGTPEQYHRLYEVTAKKIKAIDPALKVGGPALSDNLDFLEGFLRYCRDHHVPLDLFRGTATGRKDRTISRTWPDACGHSPINTAFRTRKAFSMNGAICRPTQTK